jgi:hypothetical protein
LKVRKLFFKSSFPWSSKSCYLQSTKKDM